MSQSKTQIVKDFMAANPEVTSNKEIAAALKDFGIEASHVAAAKSSMKKKEPATVVSAFDANNFKQVLALTKAIEESGGLTEVECAIISLKPLLAIVGDMATLESIVEMMKPASNDEVNIAAA